MEKKSFSQFDVMQVPLEKINLVEASAGTGKTFSIAVMVLRLILEKNINVREVLLVTFTNNAVAELDERIRLFLRSAYDYVQNNKQVSGIIKEVVDRSVVTFGKDTVIKRLNDSILFLDETSVMTIHSFCHQTLNNLAFETGQLFESELVDNFDGIITAQVHDFWRNEIVTLPVPLLSMLSLFNIDQDAVKIVVKNFLAGKRYHTYSENARYETLGDHKFLAEQIKARGKSRQNAYSECAVLLEQHKESLKKDLESDRFAKVLVEHLDDVDSFIEIVNIKRDNKYIGRLIPEQILAIIDGLSEEEEVFDSEFKNFIDTIYCAALERVSAGVVAYCNAKGVQSYDGLIKNLHTALMGPNKDKITASLKRKYRAVFIDEFQDTDKLQYDIFLGAFGSGEILFLIGDPKQSIYAFRQADINTYFKAYKDADNLYNMNINFRSSKSMIESMNEFFMPRADFDFFYFQNAENAIQYFQIASPDNNTKGNFTYEGKIQNGITISIQKKQEDVLADVGRQVFELLTDNEFKIETPEGARKMVPADIGILVKSKDCGREIKNILGRYNIPCVFVADEKIMETEEAQQLFDVIKAIFDPAIENLNAAIVNNFTGFKSTDAVFFDAEKIVELFKAYKSIWETQSIYSSLAAFISDFGIEAHLRRPETLNGLRIITNLYQLMELMHKTAYHQRLNQAELLNWYKRALEIELLEKNESTLRLESDADAVTIMTIHKSKGLQFNIVIAPQMNFQLRNKDVLESLYENDEYITIPKKEMNEEQAERFRTQSEQEFRRLMYVTVTRAVYKAFVFHNAWYKNSLLADIISGNNPGINIINEPIDVSSIDYTQKYQSGKDQIPVPAILRNKFQLKDPFWRYMSYSRLAAKETLIFNQATPLAATTEISEYDDFVFSKLRKGNITGNMIHYIFERIHFGNDEYRTKIIADAVNRFAGSNTKMYNHYLTEFIDHVLNSNIDTGEETFCLASVSDKEKVAELEFDFSTGICQQQIFSDTLKTSGIHIQLKSAEPLHGLMKGFIDLLFVHKGKYYILDWKSNVLGNKLEDYAPANLERAMQQLNYQLQLIIYTMAVTKYLRSRLGSFDYESFGGVIYCFVRGMRRGSQNGIYFFRPEEKLISQMEENLSSTQNGFRTRC